METASSELTAEAAETVAEYLRHLDVAVPGLISSILVIGSAVLGDYSAVTSDLDVVAELAGQPTEDDLRDLAGVHMGPCVHVDAVYLRPGELVLPVSEIHGAGWARDGVLNISKRSDQLHDVTWLQLARYGVAARGTGGRPQADVPRAKAHCRRRLDEYWRPLITQVAVMLRGWPDGMCELRYPVRWLGLWPARLWHTIHTGEIVSKSRAGELAAERWPDLAEPLADLVRGRAGEPVTTGPAHIDAAVELANRIFADVAG